ncbi:MAG: substrate-binding domain-containing protein [Chlorobium sp.]|jgi:phosphate transport system substrate-binding protein|nr:substrate-binding domain-containing protein [Chlorobium sp.]
MRPEISLRSKRVAAGIALLLLFALPLYLFFFRNSTEPAASREQSPTAGQLSISVDSPLYSIVNSQAQVFSDHYPDAHLLVKAELSSKTLLRLLQNESDAALITGDMIAAEDSLFTRFGRRLRKEPVARDAVICIVNRQNPLAKLSVGELSRLYAKRESGVMVRQGQERRFSAWIAGNDYRLVMAVRKLFHFEHETLSAWQSRDSRELAGRISEDPDAVGLLFLSSFRTLSLNDEALQKIKVLAISSNPDGDRPELPSQESIYDGSYPLGVIVHYIYFQDNDLAAGFGSWLSREGQKSFERSYLAPFRQPPRTIILN